jgi:hypothetical protein
MNLPDVKNIKRYSFLFSSFLILDYLYTKSFTCFWQNPFLFVQLITNGIDSNLALDKTIITEGLITIPPLVPVWVNCEFRQAMLTIRTCETQLPRLILNSSCTALTWNYETQEFNRIHLASLLLQLYIVKFQQRTWAWCCLRLPSKRLKQEWFYISAFVLTYTSTLLDEQ